MNIQFLKGCQLISMSESLRNALEASEKPIISRQLLATGEDFVVTFLNSTGVVDSGFMLFKLDTEICQSSLSKKEDIRKTKKNRVCPTHQDGQIGPWIVRLSTGKSSEDFSRKSVRTQ